MITNKRSTETKNPIYLLSVAFGIGFISAMVGIGGASMIVPFLLSLGYAPYVIRATNVYLILLTKAASVLVFISYGILTLDYFLVVGLTSMVCVALANWRLTIYVKSVGR